MKSPLSAEEQVLFLREALRLADKAIKEMEQKIKQYEILHNRLDVKADDHQKLAEKHWQTERFNSSNWHQGQVDGLRYAMLLLEEVEIG